MLTCILIPGLSRRASRTMCVHPASHPTVHISRTSSAYLQPILKRKVAPVSTRTPLKRCPSSHPRRPQPSRSPHRLVRQHPLPRPRVLASGLLVPLALSHPAGSPRLHPVTSPASTCPPLYPTGTSGPWRAPSPRTHRAPPPIQRASPTHPVQCTPLASHSCHACLYPTPAQFGSSCG